MLLSRISRLGLIASAIFLAGCVAEGGPDYRPPVRPAPSQPQMCPMIYAPVCGERGHSRKTFGNACQARADGYRIVGNGQCSSRPGADAGWGGDDRAVRHIRATDLDVQAPVRALENICRFAHVAVTTGRHSQIVVKQNVRVTALPTAASVVRARFDLIGSDRRSNHLFYVHLARKLFHIFGMRSKHWVLLDVLGLPPRSASLAGATLLRAVSAGSS